MSAEFRAGDIVRLVDAKAFAPKRRPPFPADTELKVLRVSEVSGCLVIAGYGGFWKPERFELVRHG